MDWERIAPEMVQVILGGGLATALGTIIVSRRQARHIAGEEARAQALLPAEVDSMIVQGAEHTVTLMQAANERLVAELQRKSEDLAYKDNEIMGQRSTIAAQADEIVALRTRVMDLGAQLAEANQRVHEALVKVGEVSRAYTDLRATVYGPTTVDEQSQEPTDG